MSFKKRGEVSLLGLIVVDSLVTELFLASLVGQQIMLYLYSILIKYKMFLKESLLQPHSFLLLSQAVHLLVGHLLCLMWSRIQILAQ